MSVEDKPTMFRRLRSILVGLDGSAYSEVAMELGIRWAKRSGGMLSGIGVIDEPTITKPTSAPLGAFHLAEHSQEVQLQHERHRIEQFLSKFALCCAEAGVAHRVIEKEGHPHERLLQEAQRYDLVVLGRQTFFRYDAEDQPDDTLTEVIKNSPRPVVTTPEHMPHGESIIIAYDGSLQAARALYAFWAAGVGSERQLHILAVDTNHAEAVRKSMVASEFLHAHKLETVRHAISPTGSVENTILDKIKELDAGMLVMGAYGKSGRIRDFFLGSVTRHLLKHSPVPIFVSH